MIGTDTNFREQVGSRDLLGISKTFKVEVEQVVSDTELILKKPLDQPLEDDAFKVIPHVDQHVLYDKVHACLAESGCIEIFPEGGSHDQSQMLPLKGKTTLHHLFTIDTLTHTHTLYYSCISWFCYYGIGCNGRAF